MVGLGSTAAMPLAARAQHAAKLNRVAYLALVAGEGPSVIKQRLQELGYIEGRNLIFDYRSAEGQAERLPQLATDVVRTNPDVFVTGPGTLTVKAAQTATATIPIVFSSIGDPIGAGIITSLNRPGANITGVTIQASEIGRKRLQVLRELVPGIRIVAVLMNPDTPFSALALQELRVAADAGGQVLEVFEVRIADKLASSLEAAVQSRCNRSDHNRRPLPRQPSAGNRRSRSKASTSDDLRKQAIRRSRRIDFVRNGHATNDPARGGDCRQNPERHKARGHSRRAADKIPTRDQRQDRKNAWP